jgi:hypothetical protein
LLDAADAAGFDLFITAGKNIVAAVNAATPRSFAGCGL